MDRRQKSPVTTDILIVMRKEREIDETKELLKKKSQGAKSIERRVLI